MSLDNFDKLIDTSVKNSISFRFCDLDDFKLHVERRRSLKLRYSDLLTSESPGSDRPSLLFDNNTRNNQVEPILNANGRSYSRSIGYNFQMDLIPAQPRARLTNCSARCESVSDIYN